MATHSKDWTSLGLQWQRNAKSRPQRAATEAHSKEQIFDKQNGGKENERNEGKN